jgi:hypothetical protein
VRFWQREAERTQSLERSARRHRQRSPTAAAIESPT